MFFEILRWGMGLAGLAFLMIMAWFFGNMSWVECINPIRQKWKALAGSLARAEKEKKR